MKKTTTKAPKFTVGTAVMWTTHGRYRGDTIRTGTIVEIVQAGAFPVAAVDRGTAIPRSHESYVVKVTTGKDGTGKGKLFWPRVSGLSLDTKGRA